MSTLSVCPNCGTGLVTSDRFCSGCGDETVRCTNCGGVGMAGDRFCGHCGQDLPAPSDSPIPEIGTARPTPSPWEAILRQLRTTTAGEYEVIREVGRGGMAAVYLAREIALNRNVAIKVMSPGVMLSDGMMDRFHQEAVTVANLNHPNIVTVHAVREADELHFFVMEFIGGPPLDKVLTHQGPLPIPVVRAIVWQVGSALAYAHRRGVIHRDIKPGNILLDTDGRAIVTDFGIAKVMTGTTTTQTGSVHGTAAYMSPEQCYASPLTSASDQYSLGVVAYEMIAGRPPFSGESAFALMQAHTTAEAPPLSPLRPDCPPDLEAAVLRMLAKKPNDRWPSMNAALSGLRAYPVAPDDPVLEELVRLADTGTTDHLGEIIRTPVSPIPVVQRRTPNKGSLAARSTPVSPATPATPVAARTIQIEPPSLVLEVGDTASVRAVVVGGPTTSTADPVLWGTSSDTILRIERRSGVVTAQAPGVARVTASIGGVEGSIEVTVEPAAVKAVKIAAANTSPVVGEVLLLSAVVTDKAGRRLDRPVVWSTTRPEIGSISAKGELTLHAAGHCNVVAVCDSQRDECAFTVRPQPVARVEIINAPGTLVAGDSCELVGLARDEHGAALIGRTVSWASSDRAIATITERGVLTAHEPGTVTLTARCDGKQSTTRLTIAPAPLARISVTSPVTDLVAKQRVRLTAVGTDVRGARVQIKPRWRSSDSTIVSVSDKGEVTATSVGTATIVARADGMEGAIILSVIVSPVASPLTDPHNHGIPRSGAGAAPPTAVVGGSWYKPVIAAVGSIALLGALYFVFRGTTDEPVESTPTKPRTFAPRSVALSDPPSVVHVGDTFPLSAAVRGGDSLSGSPTRWESLTPAARVDPSGQVSALTTGHAVIVASSGDARDTAAFDILAATSVDGPARIAALEIQLPPGSSPLRIGDRIVPQLVAFDSARARVRVGPVSWSSSNPRIATVDARTGEVTALSSGSTRIFARGNSRRAEATIVVQPVAVHDVVISGPDQLQTGESAQLTATARDANNHQIADVSIAWSSANRSILQVDPTSGHARAGEAGQTVITASAGSVTATKIMIVARRPEIAKVDSTPRREPAPEELMRAGEAAIRNAVEGYARELGARNAAHIRSLYNPITDDDRKNLDALNTLMSDRGLTLVRATVGTPRLEARRVLVDLATRLKWKAFAGAGTEQNVPFVAVFELSGTEWRLVSCRIVGKPRLT